MIVLPVICHPNEKLQDGVFAMAQSREGMGTGRRLHGGHQALALRRPQELVVCHEQLGIHELQQVIQSAVAKPIKPDQEIVDTVPPLGPVSLEGLGRRVAPAARAFDGVGALWGVDRPIGGKEQDGRRTRFFAISTVVLPVDDGRVRHRR